jgi:propionyl-CoA carboxylase alpha chain
MLRTPSRVFVHSRRLFSAASNDAAPFQKILVANRGEIACRVMATAKKMGIKTVAVYSTPEALARHVQMADEAYCIGPAQSSESYLNIPRILDVIEKSGAQAVHPGYGFLSENSQFCQAVKDMGVAFVGPPVRAIEAMGDKIESKQIAIDAGINTIPGFQGVIRDEEEAVDIAKNVVGYPVMIKASAGGGGKGMRVAFNDDEAREGFRLSSSEALNSFGDDRLFIEKFIEEPHHIEIQLVADSHGNVCCFPERECSIQRRNQKVLEESPSMLLTPETRAEMCRQSILLAKAVGYESAGTIEFLADKNQNFYFLEMNTRLQVEHPVTEFVAQVDLVEHMLKVAAGQKLGDHMQTEHFINNINGWALEARVYSEDPLRSFLPSNGSLLELKEPKGACAFDISESVRVDSGLMEGMEISTHYDPMISKLITHADTREAVIDKMAAALDEYVIVGSASFAHNTNFLSELCRSDRFRRGETPTSFIEEEFPDGFAGVTLLDHEVTRSIVAAVIAHTHGATEIDSEDDHGREANQWIITLNDDGLSTAIAKLGGARSYKVEAMEEGELKITTLDEDGEEMNETTQTLNVDYSDWETYTQLLHIDCGDGYGFKHVQYLGRSEEYCAYRFMTHGASLKATVHSPKEHRYSKHMLPPEVLNTANLIQSPMPGTLISINVTPGQEVQLGQEIAIVEAMKMQNVLRCPRHGIVLSVDAKEGDSLQVDQIIATLEDPEADFVA